jgi:hypothetical protein
MLKGWFQREERSTWVRSTWGFMKQIFPLLGGGVLVAGFMLGRPGHEALIPEHYIQSLVGGNSLWANLFASVSGALMYFATLTEVPILQGLVGAGMGKGPSLALLLAGPALSPQHAGDRRGYGCQKDRPVLLDHRGPINHSGHDLWDFLGATGKKMAQDEVVQIRVGGQRRRWLWTAR